MKAKLYHAKIVTIAVEFEVPDDTPEEKLHELLADEVKEMHNDGYLDFYDGKTGDIVLLPLGCKICELRGSRRRYRNRGQQRLSGLTFALGKVERRSEVSSIFPKAHFLENRRLSWIKFTDVAPTVRSGR